MNDIRLYSYKTVLFFQDLFFTLVAFIGAGWITQSSFLTPENIHAIIGQGTFPIIIIGFFSIFNLYSYHRIFNPATHMRYLAMAFLWSMATLSLVICFYFWLDDLNDLHFILAISVLAVIILLVNRFYSEQSINLLISIGLSLCIIGVLGLISSSTPPIVVINVFALILSIALTIIFVTLGRYFFVHVVFNVWLRKKFRRQVAVFGSNKDAHEIVNHVIQCNAPFWIAGFVAADEGEPLNTKTRKDYLGNLNELPEIVAKTNITNLIITEQHIDKHNLISLLDYCISERITVWLPPKLMPIINTKLYIDRFCGIPMIRLCSQKNTWIFNKIKHALDAIITLPIFILQLPIFLLIAVAIKLDSKGPIFYKAKAIGKNGRVFNMYKFRSMHVHNDATIHKEFVTKLIKGEVGTAGRNGKPLKITDDPRVTKVGRRIRKLSLDELPQLINVIKGDMSLVGPRPCLTYEFEAYKDWYKKRTAVRPGISGLWQVTSRSEVDFEDMILLDLYYVYNRNLTIDFNILFETAFVILGKKGAY